MLVTMDHAVHRVLAMTVGIGLGACVPAEPSIDTASAAASVLAEVVEREPDAAAQPEPAPSSDDAAILTTARELMDVQKHREAAPLIEQVLAQDPNNADAWSLRGLLNMEINEFDEALLSARKAVALDPDQETAWITIAVIEQERERLVPALHAYRRYLEVAPDGRFAGSAKQQIAKLEGK